MTPLVSIIIPVYNAASYLRECLGSILAQTFNDWEAICVNDGSTDNSGKILDEYAARDKRFKVIHQSNAGVSAARNRALDEASCEYVLIIDADDQIVPEVPLKVIESMRGLRLDFCSMERQNPWSDLDSNLGSTHKVFWGQIQRGNNDIENYDSLIYALQRVGMSSSGVIYRKRFLEANNIRYPKGIQWNEDFVFITSLILKGARFGVRDEIGYIVSFHQDSLSHCTGLNVVAAMNRAANAIMEMVGNANIAPQIALYYAQMNKWQIMGKRCKDTNHSIRNFINTYKKVLTIWSKALNAMVIMFPWLWFGRFSVLKLADRALVHFDLYYRKVK